MKNSILKQKIAPHAILCLYSTPFIIYRFSLFTPRTVFHMLLLADRLTMSRHRFLHLLHAPFFTCYSTQLIMIAVFRAFLSPLLNIVLKSSRKLSTFHLLFFHLYLLVFSILQQVLCSLLFLFLLYDIRIL